MSTIIENIINKTFKTDLAQIAQKIYNNERLTKQDGIKLFESTDILTIGALADWARINRLKASNEEYKKDYVYWINNHHLNLTNICEGECKFCALQKARKRP
ncbi:MAG: hypothetical protein M0C28_39790 [Candidatus Moduliflexus flocculans]|nr:hypothetical protein [Candidatus Moduliflexus flocculans]